MSTILTVAASCETSLPVPNNQVSGDASVVITSLACVGDSLKVRIARTEAIGESHKEVYEDMQLLWRVLMFPDTSYYYYPEDRLLMKKYKEELVLRRSNVVLTTPSGEELPLEYNYANLNYECGYKPQPGDMLSIRAECISNPGTSTMEDAHVSTATVRVPDWKPEFEIVSAEMAYKKGLKRDDLGLEEVLPDSVMDFKIHIVDNSSSIHNYRIKVQSFLYSYAQGTSDILDYDYISWVDAFFSNDPLLYDAGITGGFGPWQPFTTDVFTNQGFRNGEYYLNVQSRIQSHGIVSNGAHRAIKITLQPIDSSLANYLSSLYRARSFTPSYFTEPTSLASNINGGVGVFGAIGPSTSIIYWYPGEYDPSYPEQ